MVEEQLDYDFSQLSLMPPDPPDVRSKCIICRRPIVSCWCQYLPRERISIKSTIHILQHPFEENRNLQTAVMAIQGLKPDSCKLYRSKKFFHNEYQDLIETSKLLNTILLFPSKESVDLKEYVDEFGASFDYTFNIFVLDGTWHQASGMFHHNSFLHTVKQVMIKDMGLSKYVIRTQPTDIGVSTVEIIAQAISIVENRPDVYEALIKPLDALCLDQIKHGAVKHHSKQYLLERGLEKHPKKKKLKNIKNTNDLLTG